MFNEHDAQFDSCAWLSQSFTDQGPVVYHQKHIAWYSSLNCSILGYSHIEMNDERREVKEKVSRANVSSQRCGDGCFLWTDKE